MVSDIKVRGFEKENIDVFIKQKVCKTRLLKSLIDVCLKCKTDICESGVINCLVKNI